MSQQKEILPEAKQEEILNKVKEYTKNEFGNYPKVHSIVAIGSITNRQLGKYSKAKRGRLYSDIDLLIFVDNDFEIPKTWKFHLQSDYYTVYNIIEIGKILLPYWICRKSDYTDLAKQKIVEQRGVPFKLGKSKNKFLWILRKEK